MTRILRLSLVTLGDPATLTGGYLYHQRVASLAPRFGAQVGFLSFPTLPFPMPAAAAPLVLRGAAEADAILLDSIAAAYAGPWLAARPPRAPVVPILHQPPGGIDHGRLRQKAQAWLDRLAYARAPLVVAASEALAREAAQAGIPADRLRVVAPGSDVATRSRPAGDLRRGRKAAVLAVGNWVARKGVCELLDAVALVPPELVTVHLVGRTDVDRGYEAAVRQRLARPELAERVVVHGPVTTEEVAGMYDAADVFVLPARREPYGTVYGEAMARGLPVVGWRAGNLPHLAEHERHGLLVDTGDVAGLAAALERLARDLGLREGLGRAAAERAASFPSWEDTTARLVSLVNEVARGS